MPVQQPEAAIAMGGTQAGQMTVLPSHLGHSAPFLYAQIRFQNMTEIYFSAEKIEPRCCHTFDTVPRESMLAAILITP